MAGLGRRFLFSLVPAIMVFGGVELGLRGVGWPSPDGQFEHREPFWVADADEVDKAYPHPEQESSFAVSTDGRGLRGPLHSVDKPVGTRRVMTMGCSTTFGWGVDDAESYPAQLEERLQAGGYGKWEVINAGQPGYTSFQGLWLWDQVARDYDPDVVLIGFVVQDARRAAYTDKSQAILQQDARYLKRNLLWRSRAYLGLKSMLGQVQVRAKERGEGDASAAWRVPPADYVDNLRQLVGRVQDAGALPVLFGFPLERAGYTETHRTILKAAGLELGVAWFDPQQRMDQASRSQTLYFERDRGHANAEGNQLIARWVQEFLDEKGLLGQIPTKEIR
jgi:lysophospholipase L1-like esterase